METGFGCLSLVAVCMMLGVGILKLLGKIKRAGQSTLNDSGMDWKRALHWMGKVIYSQKRYFVSM